MSLVWLNIEPYHGPHTASAKAAMAPARGPATSRAVAQGAGNAGDADQGAEQVAHGIGIDEGKALGQHRQDVEQATIEIEIVVMEQRLVGEAADVIGDDQLAIMLLHAFVVGDRIGVEGDECQHQQDGEQRRDRQIIADRRMRQARARIDASAIGVDG